MAELERITVAMPAEMVAMLRSAVEHGGYASTSEIVRDAVRDWQRAQENYQRNRAELRAAIEEGLNSGPGMDGKEFFEKLRNRYAQ